MTDLRADLETLYASVEKGWRGRQPNEHGGSDFRPYGEGQRGCLWKQMTQEVVGTLIFPTNQEFDRCQGMVHALGFENNGHMYTWNDDYGRTWDEVKDLVKDAIGKL